MGDSTDPGPGPEVDAIDGPLRETLERSLADRLAERPGAELNLDNAFWGGHAPPRDVGEALAWIGPTCANMAVRLFARIRDIDPALELWREIRYLRNTWYGGSAGFKVVYDRPAEMRARLDAQFVAPRGRRVARDTLVGCLEHQRRAPLDTLTSGLGALLRTGAPPDAETWREVHRPEQEAVHFCVGKHEARPPELDDIHIDWRSPVVGVNEATRCCRYGFFTGVAHWAQAKFGLGKPVSPFQRLDELDAAATARGATGAWAAFAARWREVKWRLALRGDAGATEALEWLREGEATAAKH